MSFGPNRLLVILYNASFEIVLKIAVNNTVKVITLPVSTATEVPLPAALLYAKQMIRTQGTSPVVCNQIGDPVCLRASPHLPQLPEVAVPQLSSLRNHHQSQDHKPLNSPFFTSAAI